MTLDEAFISGILSLYRRFEESLWPSINWSFSNNNPKTRSHHASVAVTARQKSDMICLTFFDECRRLLIAHHGERLVPSDDGFWLVKITKSIFWSARCQRWKPADGNGFRVKVGSVKNRFVDANWLREKISLLLKIVDVSLVDQLSTGCYRSSTDRSIVWVR